MQSEKIPFTRDLVLLGGGHTHALVLKRWGMDPLPGARVTLVNPGATAAYSGMLPGHIAGHYSRQALDIDLVRLAQFAGARLVNGKARGVDLGSKLVQVENHPAIGYDILSIDVGITSDMPTLPGFAEHGIPAKPLGQFARAWSAFCRATGPAPVVVLGGGIAGAELAMAMAHRLRNLDRSPQVTLLDRNTALSALGLRASARLRHALKAQGVDLREHASVTRIHADHIELENGDRLPARFVVGAAGARPYPWLAMTGLTDSAGFVTVDDRLRSADPSVYAVGDCAAMAATPRPKAGVYAVRQAPVLYANLRAQLAETGGLKSYRPQTDYLKLVSLGEKSALAERFGRALAASWIWREKDRIDKRFMRQFQELPGPASPVLPWPRAAGSTDAQANQAICGGCGAKVGPAVLRRALSAAYPGDDAAILATGNARQVISTDHLRAFIDDPVVMTRIAAIHALGDIWAMGAKPQAAVASLVLPRQSPALAERHLTEITETAKAIFENESVELSGGHSTLGAEMTIGFTVSGICEVPPITLSGAKPGDKLLLTKPIGSGVIMAGHMRRLAKGADVMTAMHEMMRSQAAASRILAKASAMTDVTGFGLAGHLRNICEASGTGARIELARIPLMHGALALLQHGVLSTLYSENRAGFESVPDDPRAALLFDPQTAGGLLAAIPDRAEESFEDLVAAGFNAAIIGELTDQSGELYVV
ncbi:MAG: selenide, water dikinase SelD [Pseudomonadota bacterium]